MRVIPDDGPRTARIAVVAEMDAKYEMEQGKHLVGPAGQRWARWLAAAGLTRGDCYVTNVVPYRHNAQNDIKQVPRAELDDWITQLHERLGALTDPYLIVPMGNTALRALTGKVGITKHRGSIYSYRDNRGRDVKVIPTIHPSAIDKVPAWERRCLRDWERIAGDSTFREMRLPERDHRIKPSLRDIHDYLADARERAELLVFDIETPRKIEVLPGRVLKSGKQQWRRIKGERRITCVGFSFEPGCSLTIPTTEEYWDGELTEVWELIAELLALPCEKGAQNGLFDRWWLRWAHGIDVTNYRWDSRWMHHCLDVLDSHDLGYQTSIYTREPYFKDDTKEKNDEAEPGAGDIETFWRYNGKDCCVTHELIGLHQEALATSGRLRFYDTVYAACYDPMLDLSLNGIRVDEKSKRLRAAHILKDCIAIQTQLATIAGEELTGKKGDFSGKKLTRFLYETLKLPPQHDRKTKSLTAKEVTIRRLMHKYPKVMGSEAEPDKPGALILRHRRLSTLGKFVAEATTDVDGRMHSEFGWTYTLRFNASKTPNGRGANTQNTDRELLPIILPDEGHVFLEVDLSQAEDRVVKMLTGAPRLMQRARRPPWEGDEHTLAASLIFKCNESDVTKEQRYIGKRARHAGNYGLHGKTFSDALMKDGYLYDADECEQMIQTILDVDTPEVRDWQRRVRQTILRDRMLTNNWGHLIDFTYERLGDDLYRKGYAFEPQSTVGMLTKLWGLIPLHEYLVWTGHVGARIVNEKHDSLLISTLPAAAWPLYCFLRASMERPRRYLGNDLTIPLEVKLGKNAAMQHEWRRPPKRSEFLDVAHALV